MADSISMGVVADDASDISSTSGGDLQDHSSADRSSTGIDQLTGGIASIALQNSQDTFRDLLSGSGDDENFTKDLENTPVFTQPVLDFASQLPGKTPFAQHGLLAGDVHGSAEKEPWLFYNMSAPSSVFICGSQGSGKSHTLSCLLENALISHRANVLSNQLTGVVFHYDTFYSDAGGSPCEAAYLASHEGISVRVLCAPTNRAQIERIYSDLPNITVRPLRISESNLNTKRMMDLMATSSIEGAMPLYIHVVNRILRTMRLRQQDEGGHFKYSEFKDHVSNSGLKEGQIAPLEQRLDTLESFMPQEQVKVSRDWRKSHRKQVNETGNNWEPKAGQLTIVDLSCPCITPEMACSLFGICLDLFLEQKSTIGKVVALDEAHKYMTDSAESQALTESLLAAIRLQRHLGARVIISTQEPTISPKLLDLCSVTIVHRFSSPDWMIALRGHVAGASKWIKDPKKSDESDKDSKSSRHFKGVQPLELDDADLTAELFSQIVHLRTGEALLFSPSAVIDTRSDLTASGESGNGNVKCDFRTETVRLGRRVLKVRIRKRVTQDGGRSIMAN